MELGDKAGYIRRIRKDFPGAYDTMPWLSPKAAEAAEEARQDLLDDIFAGLGSHAGWDFADTKLFTHGISPGCRLCGEGLWSCLFINGICNANCFYCPSEQKDKGLPITSSVEFCRATDFADYVNRFNIRGVGFSGGEPLLTLDRVTEYLAALNHQVTHPLHTWMYTNGILATKQRLTALGDAGLKEIRFDLSANNYTLSGLKRAVGIIPIVTVEIPAIPDDLERTKQLVRDLHAAGADFLNLHQIRCTPFNRPKLQARPYTFLHGPGVTVLETELTALELIRYTLDQGIPLPVNYCSFTFRHQFQKAGAKKRNAQLVKTPWETITPAGHIRTTTLKGNPDTINGVRNRFKAAGEAPTLWKISDTGDALSFSARLRDLVDFTGLKLNVSYSATALRPEASHLFPFTSIRLNENKTVVIERDNRHTGVMLQEDEIQAFFETYLAGENETVHLPAGNLPENIEAEIRRFETFSWGLDPYF